MCVDKILVAKHISREDLDDLCVTKFILKVKLISDSDEVYDDYVWNKVERKVKHKDDYIDYEQCLNEYLEQFQNYDPEADEELLDSLSDKFGYDVLMADIYVVKEV